jgi:hypothetical protein
MNYLLTSFLTIALVALTAPQWATANTPPQAPTKGAVKGPCGILSCDCGCDSGKSCTCAAAAKAPGTCCGVPGCDCGCQQTGVCDCVRVKAIPLGAPPQAPMGPTAKITTPQVPTKHHKEGDKDPSGKWTWTEEDGGYWWAPKDTSDQNNENTPWRAEKDGSGSTQARGTANPLRDTASPVSAGSGSPGGSSTGSGKADCPS